LVEDLSDHSLGHRVRGLRCRRYHARV